VSLDAFLPCRTTKKGFVLQLDMRLSPTDPRVRWRR